MSSYLFVSDSDFETLEKLMPNQQATVQSIEGRVNLEEGDSITAVKHSDFDDPEKAETPDQVFYLQFVSSNSDNVTVKGGPSSSGGSIIPSDDLIF